MKKSFFKIGVHHRIISLLFVQIYVCVLAVFLLLTCAAFYACVMRSFFACGLCSLQHVTCSARRGRFAPVGLAAPLASAGPAEPAASSALSSLTLAQSLQDSHELSAPSAHPPTGPSRAAARAALQAVSCLSLPVITMAIHHW